MCLIYSMWWWQIDDLCQIVVRNKVVFAQTGLCQHQSGGSRRTKAACHRRNLRGIHPVFNLIAAGGAPEEGGSTSARSCDIHACHKFQFLHSVAACGRRAQLRWRDFSKGPRVAPRWRTPNETRSSYWSWWSRRTTAAAPTAARPVGACVERMAPQT